MLRSPICHGWLTDSQRGGKAVRLGYALPHTFPKSLPAPPAILAGRASGRLRGGRAGSQFRPRSDGTTGLSPAPLVRARGGRD